MLLLLAFLVVLIFAGLGFALHFLWIVAVILLVLCIVGFAVGRRRRGRQGDLPSMAISTRGTRVGRLLRYRGFKQSVLRLDPTWAVAVDRRLRMGTQGRQSRADSRVATRADGTTPERVRAIGPRMLRLAREEVCGIPSLVAVHRPPLRGLHQGARRILPRGTRPNPSYSRSLFGCGGGQSMDERFHCRWKRPQEAGIGKSARPVVEPAVGPPNPSALSAGR